MGSSTQAANNGNDKARSDLTTIRGIGISRKQWLNELGIYTIADLSQASADAVESQLKSNGRLLSRNELEEWIAQAKTTDRQNQQAKEFSTSDQPSPEPEMVASTDWNSIAVFRLDYQTRKTSDTVEQRTVIHHLETNATESWPGFETQRIHPWMLNQLKAVVPPAAAENPIVLDITQLRVIQPHHAQQSMIVDRDHPLFFSAVSTHEPFALEVSMQIAELSDLTLQEQIPCTIQCIIHDVSTGSTTTLGEITTTISPTRYTLHKALLPELMLSQSGIYRLKVLVTSQEAANLPAASGCFKVPMLQVI